MAKNGNGGNKNKGKNPEAERKEQLAALVSSGDLAAVDSKVNITAKASPDGKAHDVPYTKFVALTLEGALGLCYGKMEHALPKPEEGDDNRSEEEKRDGVLWYFSYGHDLEVRRILRGRLMATLEDPEKAIAKAVEKMVESGFEAAEAREMVINQRRKTGLPVPE